MKNYYYILALFLLSLIICIPLFHGKIIHVHDTLYAFIKTVSMYQSWTYGDFVGRWTPDIIQGYGYPAFNYYAPFFFVVTAALSAIVHNFIWGFNLGLFLTIFGSGCAMYLYAKQFWGKEGGFLSAVAYLFAPYHLIELYVRGACGELTAFVFIPLTLYGFHRLSLTPNIFYFLTATVSLAGLALAHNLTAMFCYPLLFVYAVIIVAQKKFGLRWMMLYLSIFAIALSLSAYFWVPALLESKFVQISRIVQNYDYRQHFLYWDQLFYGAWGNGGSGPGKKADGMSFQIGYVHLIFALIVLLRLKKLPLQNPSSRILITFWFLVALLAALLTLEISAPVWKMIPILHLASLPWRFLLVVAIAISFLAGGICSVFKQSPRMICLWGSALIIAANIFYCHNFGYETIKFKNPKEFLQSHTPLDAMEYLPRDVKMLRLIPSENKLEIIQGEGRVLDHRSSSGLRHSYDFLATTPVMLFFHSFYFPGWEVRVDHQITPILADNPFGLIGFIVPEGKHVIEVSFKNTPIRSILQGFSLTILILLVLGFLILYFTGHITFQLDNRKFMVLDDSVDHIPNTNQTN